MKRKVLFSILTIALFGFAISFNLNQKSDSQPERLLKNVEALATVTDDHDENEDGGGGAACDLCVIKDRKGETVFACKYKINYECSKSSWLGSVSCNNATECSSSEY